MHSGDGTDHRARFSGVASWVSLHLWAQADLDTNTDARRAHVTKRYDTGRIASIDLPWPTASDKTSKITGDPRESLSRIVQRSIPIVVNSRIRKRAQLIPGKIAEKSIFPGYCI